MKGSDTDEKNYILHNTFGLFFNIIGRKRATKQGNKAETTNGHKLTHRTGGKKGSTTSYLTYICKKNKTQ